MSRIVTTTTTTLSLVATNTINVASSANGVFVGMQVSGTNIGVGAVVTGVLNGTITLSVSNSGNVSIGTTITFTDVGGIIGPGLGHVVSANVSNDYNTIQAIVSKVLGTPVDATPQYGYNQSVISTPVTNSGGASNALNLITVSQWANLRTDMIKARGHQTGNSSEANSVAIPTADLLITEAYRANYLAYANTLLTYATTIGSGQYTIESVSTAVRTAIWNGNIQSVITVVFGDKPTARAYFNAGGLFLLTMTLTGVFSASSTVKDNTWATMMSQIGTITFGSNYTSIGVGSTATSVANSIGYFQLTTSNQLILEKDAPSGAYSANRLYVYARLNDTTSGTIIFTIQYQDLSGQPNVPWGTDEYVDGTLSQYLVAQRPTGGYVSLPALTVSVTGDLTPTTGSVYGLRSSVYSVDEGGSFTITLTTQGVADNTYVPYIVSGISGSRLSVGATSGTFLVIGNAATAQFAITNNLLTDGPTTFTLTLSNGLASVNVTINDTSKTPSGSQTFLTNGTFTTGAGTTSFSVLLVGGGGGGHNNGGGGGAAGQIITATYSGQTPGASYGIIIGAGGVTSGGTGGTTSFGAYNALGGSGGTGGGVSGYIGGQGGSTPGRYSGGSGTATNQGQLYRWAGGGGAGYTGNGSAGSLNGSSVPVGGDGGPGSITFNNATQFIGGGGGGGTTSGLPGGASNGGGIGGSQVAGSTTGRDAVANTGGGGGGGGGNSGSGYVGGVGGTGLVIVVWP